MRVTVDAIVQAGLSARIAFSLAGGLVRDAAQTGDDELAPLVEEAQRASETAKNADMSLDFAFVDDDAVPAELLRDAAEALTAAAEAFEAAADLEAALSERRDPDA